MNPPFARFPGLKYGSIQIRSRFISVLSTYGTGATQTQTKRSSSRKVPCNRPENIYFDYLDLFNVPDEEPNGPFGAGVKLGMPSKTPAPVKS
jgi:hypothetical protein